MKYLKIEVMCFVCMFLLFNKGNCQSNSNNKQVVKRYFEEVVNKQKIELVETVFSDSFRTHVLLDNTSQKGTVKTQKEFLSYFFNAFPDAHYSIEDVIENEDKIVARVIFSGTHKDEFWGYEASGNKIDYLSEIFFYRFENGKIVEQWVQFDLYNLYKVIDGNMKGES